MTSNITISPAGQGERIDAGPTTNIVRVGGAATSGRMSVIEMRIDAGFAGPPPHVHREVEHLWYVLDGEVDLTVDATTGRYGRGDCLYVPAGAAHAFSTARTAGVTVLEVDTPRALDGYFRALAAAFPPGTAIDPGVVAGIMREHDTTPVGVGT